MRIVEEIAVIGKPSFNQLKKIVCKEKKLMSERTFRIYLKDLVQDRVISRNHDEKSQKVYYSKTESTTSFFMEFCEERLKEKREAVRSRLDALKRSFSSLSVVEQSNVLAPFVRLLGLARIDSAITNSLYNSTAIVRENMHLQSLTEEAITYVKNCFSELESHDDKQNVLHLLYYINDPQFDHDSQSFDSNLRMYTFSGHEKS